MIWCSMPVLMSLTESPTLISPSTTRKYTITPCKESISQERPSRSTPIKRVWGVCAQELFYKQASASVCQWGNLCARSLLIRNMPHACWEDEALPCRCHTCCQRWGLARACPRCTEGRECTWQCWLRSHLCQYPTSHCYSAASYRCYWQLASCIQLLK